MRGANMSVIGCEVMENFTTSRAGERALSNAFVVRFLVTVEVRFIRELLVAARTPMGFLTSMN